MLEYMVSFDRNNNKFIIDGGFAPNSIAINIPNDDPDRKKFIHFFLHKSDLDRAIEFLKCISIDKNVVVNEGLFIAAINSFFKCFKHSASRERLSKDEIFKDNKYLEQIFSQYEIIRDKHIMHDENIMLQAIAFLPINSDNNSTDIFGRLPSVVWNRVILDYYLSGQTLQELVNFVKSFIINQIDLIGMQIIKRYEKISRDKLIKFESTNICLASVDNIRRKD